MARRLKPARLDTELRIIMDSRQKAALKRAANIATRRTHQNVTMASIAREGISLMLERLAQEEAESQRDGKA